MSHPQRSGITGEPDDRVTAPLTRHDVERIARTLGGVPAVVRLHPARADRADRQQLAFHGLRLVLDPETPAGEVWVSSNLQL